MGRKEQEQARLRAEIIMQVRSGQISATEGARRLGVSRKTYYKWEERALQGMMEGLADGQAGRPTKPKPDREKVRLEKKVDELEKRLETMAEVHELKGMLEILRRGDPPSPGRPNKTPPRRKKKR